MERERGRPSSHRLASHAGSWYSNIGRELSQQLAGWLEAANSSCDGAPRAIISPHAGYSYSGPTAAYAFKLIRPQQIKRVFILGPSHHFSLNNCALTKQTVYDTPIGPLNIDEETNMELMQTGFFCRMSKDVDEDEHSIEMQLPYIYKVFEGHDIKIVPIMVGSISQHWEEQFGRVMAPYLAKEENFFVISSDFCHWGKRFSYQYYDSKHGEIYESISWLDHEGMRIIEIQNPQHFHAYRKEFRNTICGRHPIAILLNALKEHPNAFDLRFVRYAQSSECRSMRDSSVSYASAVVVPTTPSDRSSPPNAAASPSPVKKRKKKKDKE